VIPSAVRDGLKTNLQTIAGLRVYDLIPEIPTPPCAIVGQLDFTFDIDNARGLDRAEVDIYVIVQRYSERAGQDALDTFLRGTGATSIKTALEIDRTLGGAVNTLRVTNAQSGTYDSQGNQFISYRYSLTIWG